MKNVKILITDLSVAIILLVAVQVSSVSAINYNAPVCGIGASPGSVTTGEATTLWWWSSNAETGTINGESVVASGGSKYFVPIKTDAYVFTVTGAEGTKTCSTTITVNEPKQDLPVCGIGASPHTIERGQGTAVWWWSHDAVSATVNGDAVSSNSSMWIYPDKTTKYTFVGKGKSGAKTKCEITVEVTEPTPDAPICSTGFTSENVNKGDTTTYWWWTSNATSVKLNGKQQRDLVGYVSFVPEKNETYLLEVTGPGGTTKCTSSVKTIDPKPLCSIGFSPKSVQSGNGTTLWWWTNFATEATVNGIKVDVPQGHRYFIPTSTETFTMEVKGSGGTATCSETIGVFDF